MLPACLRKIVPTFRRGGSAEWPDVEITLSLCRPGTAGRVRGAAVKAVSPAKRGRTQRRVLTAVSTGAGCHEPTGMSFARTRLAVERTTPRVAGIVRQRPPLGSIYCEAMRRQKIIVVDQTSGRRTPASASCAASDFRDGSCYVDGSGSGRWAPHRPIYGHHRPQATMTAAHAAAGAAAGVRSTLSQRRGLHVS